MPPYIVVEKKQGETPLHALARLRTEQRIPSSIPLTYAGRLDPLAEGKLLILVGEECKRQRAYHGLDKEYRFEILFGFSSDTGDLMGLPSRGSDLSVNASSLRAMARKLQGEIALPYPHYSSKTVKGKPLFQWTLEGRLGEIEIPVAETRLYTTQFENLRTVSFGELRESAVKRINTLPAVTDPGKDLGRDFRRSDIIPAWKDILTGGGEVHIATFVTIASSGTYVRSLAPYIATRLGASGLAYSIRRTEIGKYFKIPGTPWGFWVKRYR